MLLGPEHAPALELLFRAVHGTIGPCRFEGATFRTTALAIPLVQRAAEAYVGGLLGRPGERRVHGESLTRKAFWVLSTEVMHVWPFILEERGLIIREHWSWIYWDTGTGLPPRIDHVTNVRLPSANFRWVACDG